MGLHLVSGTGPGDGGGGDEADRLTEAERLLRRTRQRLEDLADRLADLRRRIGQPGPEDGPAPEDDPREKTDPNREGENPHASDGPPSFTSSPS